MGQLATPAKKYVGMKTSMRMAIYIHVIQKLAIVRTLVVGTPRRGVRPFAPDSAARCPYLFASFGGIDHARHTSTRKSYILYRKLLKTPLIKVHSHLITVNHTQSNIFGTPSPLPLFYQTKNRQTIVLYGFKNLVHVKKMRDFDEKKPQQLPRQFAAQCIYFKRPRTNSILTVLAIVAIIVIHENFTYDHFFSGYARRSS